ncbi:MAG: isoleucine--tRNA ligase [Deltaproteobacteria bacterium]|nr:isoleucine--tRNA ligase [Deltaproteobacteria bacterium]
MDYKKTLNLPRTDFPMRAGLPKLEPELLARWREQDLYAKLKAQRQREGAGRFILHDGPPYANGHVHLGTALNKILKDIIVKSHAMVGHFSPYVPGWDCHGMPIEHNVIRELGDRAREMSKLEIRSRCREFASKYLDVQREEFQRLGCLGDWQDPYITMSRQYESEIVAALGDLVRGGYVYRGKRPIHWCATCQTALAEAELEYHEHSSPSIYVKFEVREGDAVLAALAEELGEDLGRASVLIWTTTPWTIPANLAIALHPEHDYVFVRHGDECTLMADYLRPVVCEALGWTDARSAGGCLAGARFEGMRCRHPIFDRDSLLVLADYVTLDAGTGCVHTAPGHGAEDFETGKAYDLPILAPVDNAGCFTDEVPGYEGVNVFDANGPISDDLERRGALLAREEIAHSYPFCWRCKQPLIFRATEQWFVDVDANDLRKRALAEIEKVSWVPAWGQQRIHNMVECRPDWCLSRQRAWGVPIPALYCTGCGRALLDAAVIDRAVERVAAEGADAWYARPASDFVTEGLRCPGCGGATFDKEEDILDVWFDSSVSQRAVLEHHADLAWPCDLYLEATDQHRGWFQVSLLTAVGTRGEAPFRQVLTHGLILDESAKKMSKSMGNVIAPQEVIDHYGADVLRLLFASVDYTADICFTRDMLGPMTDAYRKMRNTLRFMLGNLSDFDPADHAVEEADSSEIDRFIHARMRQVAAQVRKAYLDYEFHTIYRLLLELCTVDLSAFFLDAIKDRLYADAPDDPRRRAAQTALYASAIDLLAMLAPILSFTAEEAWGYLPADSARPESVHLARLPDGEPREGDAELLDRWSRFRQLRGEINKALESVRQAGAVKSSLDARVELEAEDGLHAFLGSFDDRLDVCKVASLERVDDTGAEAFASSLIERLRIRVSPSADARCERCWNRRPEVGRDGAAALCARCAEVLERTGASS